MNEHLRQQAEIAAMAAGHTPRDDNIGGNSSDSVPVDGDITDMLN